MNKAAIILLRRAAIIACVVIAAPLIYSCASTKPAHRPEYKVGWQDALEIAEGLAPQYGYDLDYMNIEILLDITPWDNRFPDLPFYKQPRYQEINAKLEGRHYWSVNCLPTFPHYGGSFCVFIDAETGEVVHVFTGW